MVEVVAVYSNWILIPKSNLANGKPIDRRSRPQLFDYFASFTHSLLGGSIGQYVLLQAWIDTVALLPVSRAGRVATLLDRFFELQPESQAMARKEKHTGTQKKLVTSTSTGNASSSLLFTKILSSLDRTLLQAVLIQKVTSYYYYSKYRASTQSEDRKKGVIAKIKGTTLVPEV